MDKSVLVAYATKYGATAEIAEKIGQVLRDAGLEADVLPAEDVGGLDGYRAVVLGSAVYVGRWRKQAVRFLEARAEELARMPVWLFSSGPTGEGDPLELVQGRKIPGKLQPLVDRIGPHDVAIFHGALDSDKLNVLHRWMIKQVDAPAGDYRDWEAIAAWAGSIASALLAA
jgi:menaquinone-dependent protoporphyrinogen oxidase